MHASSIATVYTPVLPFVFELVPLPPVHVTHDFNDITGLIA